MQYMLLLYSTQDGPPNITSPEEAKAFMEPWVKYGEDLQAAGAFVAGDALQPTSTATCVRVRDGDPSTTDGPFAETTETLGGYYLIEVPDLDAALRWAAACPLSAYGTVEVRPVQVFS